MHGNYLFNKYFSCKRSSFGVLEKKQKCKNKSIKISYLTDFIIWGTKDENRCILMGFFLGFEMNIFNFFKNRSEFKKNNILRALVMRVYSWIGYFGKMWPFFLFAFSCDVLSKCTYLMHFYAAYIHHSWEKVNVLKKIRG